MYGDTPVRDWKRRDMYGLNATSRKNIHEVTGMTVEQIVDMDFEDIDACIAKKVGHKIREYIIDERLANRGQVYSETTRFLHMDDVDKGLKKHDRRKSPFIRKTISTI